MTPLRLYTYRHLEGPTWIRVLHLLPAASRDEPLKCYIRHLDRESLAKVDWPWETGSASTGVKNEDGDSSRDGGSRDGDFDSDEEELSFEDPPASPLHSSLRSEEMFLLLEEKAGHVEAESVHGVEATTSDRSDEPRKESKDYFIADQALRRGSLSEEYDAADTRIHSLGWNYGAEAEAAKSPESNEYPYEAISYVWGEKPYATEQLTVLEEDERQDDDDRRNASGKASAIMLTPHVDNMLRVFRSSSKVSTFWIDAICLNQRNSDEMAQQIALMADIYGDASRTRVWLGSEDGDVADLFEALRKRKKLGSNYKLAVNTFLERPWFSRRWVLQELALSKHAFLYAHESCIAYTEVRAGLSSLWFMANRSDADIVLSSTATRSLKTLLGFRDSITSLSRKLFDNHQLMCSNPKDRLLAFHGLSVQDPMWAAQIERTGSRAWMYDMTWHEFYKAVSRYYIESDQKSEPFLLHCAAFGSLADADSALPSWCPNWSQPRRAGTTDWLRVWAAEEVHHFQAYPAQFLGVGIRFDADERRLFARQRVVQVSHILCIDDDMFSNVAELPSAIEPLAPQAKITTRTTDSEICIAQTTVMITTDRQRKHLLNAPALPNTYHDTSILDTWKMLVDKYTAMCSEAAKTYDDPTRFHEQEASAADERQSPPGPSVDHFVKETSEKFILFTTMPFAKRLADERRHFFYGVGICERDLHHTPLGADDRIMLSPETMSVETQTTWDWPGGPRLHAFVRALDDAEKCSFPDNLATPSNGTLSTMAERGWDFNTHDPTVCRIGGSVFMLEVEFEPHRRRSVPHLVQDLVIV